MFTKLEKHSWIKIEAARDRSTQVCFQGLRESCGDGALPYRTVARLVQAFLEGRDTVQHSLSSGQLLVENNTLQLLASLLDADRRWTARELAAEVREFHKTLLYILHGFWTYRKVSARWILHEISEVQQWHRYAVAQTLLDRWQREGDDFLGRIVAMGLLTRTKIETPIKWIEASRFSTPYIMCCECDVHCGVWHWCDNTAPRCTSKADGKRCLLLHFPAVPP